MKPMTLIQQEMEQIEARRIKLGITHETLADRVGIHRSHYTALKLGTYTPKADTFLKIKQALEALEAESEAAQPKEVQA